MGPGEDRWDAVFFILWWMQLIAAVYLIWRVLLKRNPLATVMLFTGGLIMVLTAAVWPYHTFDDDFILWLAPFTRYLYYSETYATSGLD